MKIFDLFMPRNIKCAFCGEEDYKYGICDKCLETMPFIKGRTCVKCGGRVLNDEIICRECEKVDHAFNNSYALFDYTGDIKRAINLFKRNGNLAIGRAFSHIICDYIERMDIKVDMIIPMPIHPNRYNERGFNQAEILCGEIANRYPKLLNNDILIRIKDTPHQTGLNRDNRLLNLSGAFQITNIKKVKNKKILVIDDIFTTGSTLDECAFALLKAGAKSVQGLCLARGLVYDIKRDSEKLVD